MEADEESLSSDFWLERRRFFSPKALNQAL